jgi:hypothetical protein
MTTNEFRELALALPETAEAEHMGHPDFRVGGKIFASLGYPDESWGMVKLTPDQQEEFVREDPAVFEPVPGGWGRRGSTRVRLERATEETLRPALAAAWRNTAPRRLAARLLGPEKSV